MLGELGGKGLGIVTVNLGDPAATVAQFWREKRLRLGVVLDADGRVAERYRVNGVPVNYLVGSNGKVLAAFDGFDEAALRQALKKAGIE